MIRTIERRTATAFEVRIFIAGDISDIKREAAKAAMAGACYSIEETEFVYTMGRERGAVLRLVNYPRFPATLTALMADAERLAVQLLEATHQGSCLIQPSAGEAVWLTRRGDA